MMIRRFLILAVATAVLAASWLSVAAAVDNWNFQSGLAGWEVTGAVVWNPDGTDSNGSDPGSAEFQGSGIISQTTTLSGAQWYLLSFDWYWLGDDFYARIIDEAGVVVSEFDSSFHTGQCLYNGSPYVENQWNRCSTGVLNADPGTYWIQFEGTGYGRVDYVTESEVAAGTPTPTATASPTATPTPSPTPSPTPTSSGSTAGYPALPSGYYYVRPETALSYCNDTSEAGGYASGVPVYPNETGMGFEGTGYQSVDADYTRLYCYGMTSLDSSQVVGYVLRAGADQYWSAASGTGALSGTYLNWGAYYPGDELAVIEYDYRGDLAPYFNSFDKYSQPDTDLAFASVEMGHRTSSTSSNNPPLNVTFDIEDVYLIALVPETPQETLFDASCTTTYQSETITTTYNILTNPGFEAGLTQWDTSGGYVGIIGPASGYTPPERYAYEGDYAIEMTADVADKYICQTLYLTSTVSYLRAEAFSIASDAPLNFNDRDVSLLWTETVSTAIAYGNIQASDTSDWISIEGLQTGVNGDAVGTFCVKASGGDAGLFLDKITLTAHDSGGNLLCLAPDELNPDDITPTPTPSPTPIGTATPTPTPSPTPQPDDFPVPDDETGGSGTRCYLCPRPTDFLDIGGWLAWLGCLIKNLFSCSLRIWFINLGNWIGGVLANMTNYLAWFMDAAGKAIAWAFSVLGGWYGYLSKIVSYLFDGLVAVPEKMLTYFLQSGFVQSLWNFVTNTISRMEGLSLLIDAATEAVQRMASALIEFLEMIRDLFLAVRDSFAEEAYTITIVTSEGSVEEILPSQLYADGPNMTKVLWMFLASISAVDHLVGLYDPYLQMILLLSVGTMAVGTVFWTLHHWRDILPI